MIAIPGHRTRGSKICRAKLRAVSVTVISPVATMCAMYSRSSATVFGK